MPVFLLLKVQIFNLRKHFLKLKMAAKDTEWPPFHKRNQTTCTGRQRSWETTERCGHFRGGALPGQSGQAPRFPPSTAPRPPVAPWGGLRPTCGTAAARSQPSASGRGAGTQRNHSHRASLLAGARKHRLCPSAGSSCLSLTRKCLLVPGAGSSCWGPGSRSSCLV